MTATDRAILAAWDGNVAAFRVMRYLFEHGSKEGHKLACEATGATYGTLCELSRGTMISAQIVAYGGSL